MATPAEQLETGTDLANPATEPVALAHRERQIERLWQIIGAAKSFNRLAKSLGSQSIRGYQQVRDEKLYLPTGFEKFREFMDRHPQSEMTYDQFNRREKLLEAEGDIVFDLLTSLNVPLTDRKLLAGQVEVDGNELRIGDSAPVRLDDEVAILDLISTQHSKLLEQQRTIERGKKDVENWKRKTDAAEKRAVIANPDATETGQALLTLAGAFKNLRERLESASPEEKQALRDEIFDLLRNGQLEMSVALGVASKEEIAAAKSDDDGLLTD